MPQSGSVRVGRGLTEHRKACCKGRSPRPTAGRVADLEQAVRSGRGIRAGGCHDCGERRREPRRSRQPVLGGPAASRSAPLRDQGGQREDPGFEGTISSLQARLTAVQQSLDIQEQQLEQVTVALSSAQRRLVQLQRQLASDRRILASQLVADYESPTPNLVDVIVESRGWNDLVNKVSNLKTIADRQFADDACRHYDPRGRCGARPAGSPASRSAGSRPRRRCASSATTSRSSACRSSIASFASPVTDPPSGRQLTKLQKTLTHEAKVLDPEAAAAGGGAGLPVVPPPGGCINTAFVPHGGSTGFFPAPGTNYSVKRGADHRRPPRRARQGARAAPDRHLRLPHPAAFGRGRRIRRRSPHPRRGFRHSRRRRRARGHARGVLPDAARSRGAREADHIQEP